MRLCSISARSIDAPASADAQYARFVAKALALRDYIAREFHMTLALRQLDRLLLNIHRDGI